MVLAASQQISLLPGQLLRSPPGTVVWVRLQSGDASVGELKLNNASPAFPLAGNMLLVGDWWRQNSGPLLAYTKCDDRPVALLPGKGDRYTLFDPIDRSRQRVTNIMLAAIQHLNVATLPRPSCPYT